jgi:hypothetical protein
MGALRPARRFLRRVRLPIPVAFAHSICTLKSTQNSIKKSFSPRLPNRTKSSILSSLDKHATPYGIENIRALLAKKIIRDFQKAATWGGCTMQECLSREEWNRIHEDYKAVEPDGQCFVLRPDTNGRTAIVRVTVEQPNPKTPRNRRITAPVDSNVSKN